MLAHLASLAVERGCARLEWWVLRTNDPALRFYRRLHARTVDEIDVLRLEGHTCGRSPPTGRITDLSRRCPMTRSRRPPAAPPTPGGGPA
ncbi:GNAT family N-acetyltransferase [Micromonospora sp. DT48]|uniref:GNAT family N-acetyltransferase n=1 Tax=unclassified Micromonospora TaxID=2617518 RepID=UPI0012BC05E8|nr:GNAT family N-acetyltransferase [Micromonospora sp. CP22]